MTLQYPWSRCWRRRTPWRTTRGRTPARSPSPAGQRICTDRLVQKKPDPASLDTWNWLKNKTLPLMYINSQFPRKWLISEIWPLVVIPIERNPLPQVLLLPRLFLVVTRPPQASEARGRVPGGEEREGEGQGGHDVDVASQKTPKQITRQVKSRASALVNCHR